MIDLKQLLMYLDLKRETSFLRSGSYCVSNTPDSWVSCILGAQHQLSYTADLLKNMEYHYLVNGVK